MEKGFGRLGPDNFILAQSKHYDSEQYNIEARWYDRAHNKLLDVLIMNGFLGLLAYLFVWFFFFASLKRRRESEFSLINLALLFLGVSFFTHLMFVFDEISTSIPFFVMLSFPIYLKSYNDVVTSSRLRIWNKLSFSIFLVFLSLFLNFVFFKNTLPGYFQMRSYHLNIFGRQNPIRIENIDDSIFIPFTIAQMNIRRDFLWSASDFLRTTPSEENFSLFKKSLTEADEYFLKRPQDILFASSLADIYSNFGYILKDSAYLTKGENMYLRLLDYSPNRPDLVRGLALNLLFQEKHAQSFELFESSFQSGFTLSNQEKEKFEGAYTLFIQYFYDIKNKNSFIKTVSRLKENNYGDIPSLEKIVDYLGSTGAWPVVIFY